MLAIHMHKKRKIAVVSVALFTAASIAVLVIALNNIPHICIINGTAMLAKKTTIKAIVPCQYSIVINELVKEPSRQIMRPDSFVNSQLQCAVALGTFIYQPNINPGLICVSTELFAAIIRHLAVAFTAMPDNIGRIGWFYTPCGFVNHFTPKGYVGILAFPFGPKILMMLSHILNKDRAGRD